MTFTSGREICTYPRPMIWYVIILIIFIAICAVHYSTFPKHIVLVTRSDVRGYVRAIYEERYGTLSERKNLGAIPLERSHVAIQVLFSAATVNPYSQAAVALQGQ